MNSTKIAAIKPTVGCFNETVYFLKQMWSYKMNHGENLDGKLNIDFKLGLLSLIYLLVKIDNGISATELDFFNQVRISENIDDNIFQAFREWLNHKSDREIYDKAIALISPCSAGLKIRAITILTEISLIDIKVGQKKIRFLLYLSKRLGMDYKKIISGIVKI